MTLEFFKSKHGKISVIKNPKENGKFFFTTEDGTRGAVEQNLFSEVDGKVKLVNATPEELIVTELPANTDGEVVFCIIKDRGTATSLEL